MTRRCELTGKTLLFGNLRSHAENKTRRVFRPNLHWQGLYSDGLRREIKLRISTRALRTVDRKGGIDNFLLTTNNRLLPKPALAVKKSLLKALARADGKKTKGETMKKSSPKKTATKK